MHQTRLTFIIFAKDQTIHERFPRFANLTVLQSRRIICISHDTIHSDYKKKKNINKKAITNYNNITNVLDKLYLVYVITVITCTHTHTRKLFKEPS